MGAHEHHAKARRVVVCAVLTVSDTRTAETDTNGTCIQALLEQAGHRVASYGILPDDPTRVRAHVEEMLREPEFVERVSEIREVMDKLSASVRPGD